MKQTTIILLLSLLIIAHSLSIENPTFQACVSAQHNAIICKGDGTEPMVVWGVEPRKYWSSIDILTEGVSLIFPGMENNTFQIYLPFGDDEGLFSALLEDESVDVRTVYTIEDFGTGTAVSGIDVDVNGDVDDIFWFGANHLLVLENDEVGKLWTVYDEGELVSYNTEALNNGDGLSIKNVGGWIFFVSGNQIAWLSSDYSSITVIDDVLHYEHDDFVMYYLKDGTWGKVKDGVDQGENDLSVLVGEQPFTSTIYEEEWLIFDYNCSFTVIDVSGAQQHLSLPEICDVRAVTVNPFIDHLYILTKDDIVIYKLGPGEEKDLLESTPSTYEIQEVGKFFIPTSSILVIYAAAEEEFRLTILNITVPTDIIVIEELEAEEGPLPPLYRFNHYPEFDMIHFIGNGRIDIIYLIPEVVQTIPENCLDIYCRTCELEWTGSNCGTPIVQDNDQQLILPIINCATQSGSSFLVFLGYLDTGATVSAPSIAEIAIDEREPEPRNAIFSYEESRRMRNFVFSEACNSSLSWEIDGIDVVFDKNNYNTCPETLSVMLILQNLDMFPTSTQRDSLLNVIKNKIKVEPTYHFVDDWQSEKRMTGYVELQLQITSSGDQSASAAMSEFVQVSEDPDLIDSFQTYLNAPTLTVKIEPFASGQETIGEFLGETSTTDASSDSTTNTLETDASLDSTNPSSATDSYSDTDPSTDIDLSSDTDAEESSTTTLLLFSLLSTLLLL